jgi:hypothetical protein
MKNDTSFNENYLKLDMEKMEKKVKNEKKIGLSVLVALISYILFFI